MTTFLKEAVGEGGSGIGGKDGFCCLGDDFSFVNFGGEFEKSDAGFLVTESNSMLDGGGTAILRQERGMDVDDTLRKKVEDFFGENVTEGS